MIPTWKIADAKISVNVNGIFIPFKSAPDLMRRFVRPALFSTGCNDWELQISGTAVVCNYRGLSIALAARHQTGDGNEMPLPEKFVVLAYGGDQTLAVPPKMIRRPSIREDEFQSLQDLCVFDFEERVKSHRIETLDLTSVRWSDCADVTTDYSFLIGYPTSSQIIKLDDEGQLREMSTVGYDKTFVLTGRSCWMSRTGTCS